MDSVQVVQIKNMVCPRCIAAVREILSGMGLQVKSVVLGEVAVLLPDGKINLKLIDKELRKSGFELLLDKNERLVERIKVALIEYLQRLESDEKVGRISSYLTEYLAEQLNISYSQLSRLFSRSAGHTVERHIILLKIERVKELLTYGELTLSEIAYRLRYSSVQHLSTQFKQVTGLSVREYKSLGVRHRHPLDSIS